MVVKLGRHFGISTTSINLLKMVAVHSCILLQTIPLHASVLAIGPDATVDSLPLSRPAHYIL